MVRVGDDGDERGSDEATDLNGSADPSGDCVVMAELRVEVEGQPHVQRVPERLSGVKGYHGCAKEMPKSRDSTE